MYSELVILSVIFSYVVVTVNAQEVLGCGGFVKSNYSIDFTKVEIQLLTSYGAIKYRTEASPNGYYMIPVYERGDYTLKITPRPGWNFEPASPVPLDLDACGKGEDFNFDFVGFDVTGLVSSFGTHEGPAGVNIQLYTNSQLISSTISESSGRFKFRKIKPGQYVLKADYLAVTFTKDEAAITISDHPLDIGDSLQIHGYSVTGKISNEGQPVKGVLFILHSTGSKSVDVRGCTAGAPAKYKEPGAICYTVSDERGVFTFQSVPVGVYRLVPFYRGEKTAFEVKPGHLDLEVAHQNFMCTEEFSVSGFAVTGSVRYRAEGTGVENARVKLDGQMVAVTGPNGEYTLEGMRAGTYTLSVEVPHVFFDNVMIRVTPSEATLPDIIASRYSVCGTVTLDSATQGVRVQILDEAGDVVSTVETDSASTFCAKLPSGTYTVEPLLHESDATRGMRVIPSKLTVTVKDAPELSDQVKFTQFLATVSGRITCIEPCSELVVMLVPEDKRVKLLQTTVNASDKEVSFSFHDVFTGRYRLLVDKNSWCWSDEPSLLTVDADIENLSIVQTGYQLNIQSTHGTKLKYDLVVEVADTTMSSPEQSLDSFPIATANHSAPVSHAVIDVAQGLSRTCLPLPGLYHLVPEQCHQFEQSKYAFSTRSNNHQISLKVIKHKVVFDLIANQVLSDVQLRLSTGKQVLETVLLPETKLSTSGMYESRAEYFIQVDLLQLLVTPMSASVLFEQPSMTVTLSADRCPAAQVRVRTISGEFVEGTINPPVSGIRITLLDNGHILQHTETDDQGHYKMGPFAQGTKYLVQAEKAGYSLTQDPEHAWNFRAYKLAEVAVRVVGEDNGPLPGVILSLSGGTYRSNNLTQQDGTFSFSGLSPGQYYLRAVLKEYQFDPVSKVMEVTEGLTTDVYIKGHKVAFSCFGKIVNLKADPSPYPIMIRATGLDEQCRNLEESSMAETSGHFRIRGLKPDCQYQLTLTSFGEEKPSLRISPETTIVKMGGADQDVGKFVVFEKINQTDIVIFLQAPSEYLSHVKVLLTRDDSSSPLHILGFHSSRVVYLPPVPMNRQKYHIQLECSLPRQTYQFSTGVESTFLADSAVKYFTFTFHPKMRTSGDYEVKESSVAALILIAVMMVAVLNKAQIEQLIERFRESR